MTPLTQGTFDPVLADWKVEPTDAKRKDTERQYYRLVAGTRRHVSTMDVSQRMGTYDPVQNRWLVPPRDPRVLEGATWQPTDPSSTKDRPEDFYRSNR